MRDIWCHDGIEVQNLTLRHPQHVTKDAWGRPKEQPILVTVRLSFRQSFSSAASSDSLDQSTVNYGTLSKRIRDLSPAESWESLDDLTSRIYRAVLELTGPDSLESSLIQVSLPKASLLGSQIEFAQHRAHLVGLSSPRLRRDLTLRGVSLPVLVGINPHERRQKQPLVFSAALIDVAACAGDDAAVVESQLVQLVEGTCFETLEALILHIARGLDAAYLLAHAPDATLRLRMEKPLAVPWADAPCLEIIRSPADRRQSAMKMTQLQPEARGLVICRPYMKS